MKYWLFKSEPGAYLIDDLKKEKKAPWDGVRNYQARNFLRDKVQKGDLVLFYHSSTNLPGIAGVGEVVSGPYPDPTQFDTKNPYFDPKSTKEKPRWYLVDVKFKEKFNNMVTLAYLKSRKKFDDMAVTQKGSRLSIQPVLSKHFFDIVKLGRKT